ncbi:MAG TPA: T9SS type A sorting domain-containing protein, partial [Saprospiraceae bacterium]|nr:T9SS type A sorting domain-containing protein [Saprospiraceae bacterium]
IKPQSDLKIFQAYFTMNKLIIESKKTQENDLTITIQNSDGRLISTKQVSRIHSASPVFELDANDIPSGAYIIKIMDGNKENSIKLVK